MFCFGLILRHCLSKFSQSNVVKSTTKGFNICKVERHDHENIIKLINDRFITDDPLCRALQMRKDNKLLNALWLENLQEGLSFKAVVDDVDGDVGKKLKLNGLIGACVNIRNTMEDTRHMEKWASTSNCKRTTTLLNIWTQISREPKLHEKFKTDRIFEVKISLDSLNLARGHKPN